MILFWESSDLKGRSFPVVMRKPNLPHALLRILSQRFLKASRRILWKSLTSLSNENQNFRLCVTVLLDRCQTFCNRTPLAVVFSFWGQNNFYTLFWGFLSTFSKFSEHGKFKSSSWSCGKQILGGCTSLVSLKLSWTVSRFGVSCRHLNRLIFGFFNFFFLRTCERRDEKIDQTSANSSDAILLLSKRSRQRQGWLLPLGRSPSVRILDLFVVTQNMTKSITERKS